MADAPDLQRPDSPAETDNDALSLFLIEVRRYPLLNRREEVELARRIERGDLDAKERLVNSNLRLVIANARKYEGLELTLLDLIQEGILGLIRRIDRARRALSAELGRDPTDEEIARAAELDIAIIREAGEVARVVTSLDRPVGEEDDTTFGSLIASDTLGPEKSSSHLCARTRSARLSSAYPSPSGRS